jgi:hypothetical protein
MSQQIKVFFHTTNEFKYFDDILDSLKSGDSFDIYSYVREKIEYIDNKLKEKHLKCSYYGENCTILVF